MRKNKHLLMICGLFCFMTGILAAIISDPAGPSRSPLPAVRATWVWQSGIIEDRKTELLAFASAHHVNLIYLYFDNRIPDSRYRDFIRAANAKGIQVYALSGEPSWALRTDRAQLNAFVDRVHGFNAAAPQSERFRGVNLDIEPYLLPEWSKNRNHIIEQWTETIAQIIPRIKGTAHRSTKSAELKVSLDLPFWLNRYLIPTPNGKEPLSRWMMKRSDQVTFMAYRNHARGKGGILDVLNQEICWANQDGSSIVVGLETNHAKERQSTFREAGKARLHNALNIVNSTLQRDPSYKGYAIHQYVSWRILEGEPSPD